MAIIITEKPDWISYDQIHELLWKANQTNRERGFHLRTAEMTGEELKARIGVDGKCFVALDGDKLVGTSSLRFLKRNTWYYKGVMPDWILSGIDPDYRGQGLNTRISNEVFSYVKNMGYPVIELDTAENNTHAIGIFEHFGFHLVDYRANRTVDHNSVIMVKWFVKCPYSEKKRMFFYEIRKAYSKMKKIIKK